MTKAEIKAFFATPKGKLAGALGALVLCWAIVLPTMFGDFFTSSDDPQRIRSLENDIKRQRSIYEKQLVQKKQLDDLRARYREILTNAWITEQHGMVEIGMRQMVSDAAAKLEFRLHSIGAVRVNRINNELSSAEIDIRGAESLEIVMKFISEISKLRPALSWRRLDLRPDMRFRHGRTSTSSSLLNLAQQNMNQESTRVSINGTLRVILTERRLAGTAAANKKTASGAAGNKKTAPAAENPGKVSGQSGTRNGGK